MIFSQNNSPPPSTVGPYNPPADPGQPGPFLAGQPSENRRFRNRDDEPIAGQRTGPKNRYGTEIEFFLIFLKLYFWFCSLYGSYLFQVMLGRNKIRYFKQRLLDRRQTKMAQIEIHIRKLENKAFALTVQ